jgi:hypothetical protein
MFIFYCLCSHRLLQPAHHTDDAPHIYTGLELAILLVSNPKTPTILTHTIFNNYLFSAYILYYLSYFNQNYVTLINMG